MKVRGQPSIYGANFHRSEIVWRKSHYGKSLVIVESPAKAKTINKYLGKEFIVKSSVGHIRDLPTSSSADANGKAKSAAEVRKMSPEEKAKYKKVKEKKALVAVWGLILSTAGKPTTKFCLVRRRW